MSGATVVLRCEAGPLVGAGHYVRCLALAEGFRRAGAKPRLLTPPLPEAWRAMAGNEYETPDLPSIDALARYIYESGIVVANDSGGGHLASFLQVPVVTIHRRWNRRFTWRPDWGPGAVVCPRLILPLPGTHVWRPFVSTAAILRAVDRLRRGWSQ